MISAALFFGGGVCASAQEADPKVDSESQKFRELLVNLEEKGREVQRLREQIRIASGEDREALARLAAATAEEVVADLKSLSADVVKREKSGSDVGSDREVVTGIYSKVSDFERDVIDRQRELLDRLRKEREEAPPEDLPDLEKRIIGVNNRLDTALEILVDQVEQREAFGIESSSELDYLEGILADRSKLLMGRIELARESVAAGEGRPGQR